LNTDKVNLFRGYKSSAFDTSNFGDHIPLFKRKLGEKKPLSATLGYRDMNVKFGIWETDIVLDYTLLITVFDGSDWEKEIFYDEIRVVTALKIETDNDVVYITIVKNKMNFDPRYGQKTQPMRNSLNITSNEYKDFISNLGFFLDWMRTFINEVYFKYGLIFPFNPDEIITTL
jgi:hypothetical protein